MSVKRVKRWIKARYFCFSNKIWKYQYFSRQLLSHFIWIFPVDIWTPRSKMQKKWNVSSHYKNCNWVAYKRRCARGGGTFLSWSVSVPQVQLWPKVFVQEVIISLQHWSNSISDFLFHDSRSKQCVAAVVLSYEEAMDDYISAQTRSVAECKHPQIFHPGIRSTLVVQAAEVKRRLKVLEVIVYESNHETLLNDLWIAQTARLWYLLF